MNSWRDQVESRRVQMLGMVHTKGKSPQGWLRGMWTCRLTLALAYILCCLSAT